MTRYVFITGGVVSSLGKGICSAALGALLEARGFVVNLLKLDPYLNVDAGTMSPLQHGEVYVTQDGAETDLDLGNYERFVNVTMTRANNVTTGQIYGSVIQKERQGVYLGGTIQIIPHITDEIQAWIINGGKDADIVLVEIGGTVGDIESLPFLEAIRQMRMNLGAEHTLFIHLTLVPYLQVSGEIKTKPTQHSVKECRSIGIQPDILMCRSEKPLPDSDRQKISLFSNVALPCVISLVDVPSIYQIPQLLHDQGIDEIIIKKLELTAKKAPDLRDWAYVVAQKLAPTFEVRIAMVGKYVNLADAYKSVNEALMHAGVHTSTRVIIDYVDSEKLESEGLDILKNCHAILIPGGFGTRGTEGKILAAHYARENNIPFLGICLGLQIAVIEFARNKVGLLNAHSTEFDANSPYPVIDIIAHHTNLGGTMRLGDQACYLAADSKARSIYHADVIHERHRHRYEVNNHFVPQLEQQGLKISGWSENKGLVGMIEIPSHPWFVACQFHPEFTSKPRSGHPLFTAFIQAALLFKDSL